MPGHSYNGAGRTGAAGKYRLHTVYAVGARQLPGGPFFYTQASAPALGSMPLRRYAGNNKIMHFRNSILPGIACKMPADL